MSNAGTSDNADPEKTNINIRVTESLLEDIDATWADEGYNSRSEFVREALRDAVRHPRLTRESWKEIAAVEHARRSGESEGHSIASSTRRGIWNRSQPMSLIAFGLPSHMLYLSGRRLHRGQDAGAPRIGSHRSVEPRERPKQCYTASGPVKPFGRAVGDAPEHRSW